MNLDNLKYIENKYNFKYPKIYKNLLNDGMLNWGDTCSDWIYSQYPKLKDKPPFLLYGVDFELITNYEEIIEEIESLSDVDDYRQTKEEFYNKFIPFGRTYGGDLYCFYLDGNNEVQNIVVIWCDVNEAEILAKNLEGYIFRNLLECIIDPYEESLIMNGNFKENIWKQFSTHKNYLSENQVNVIKEIYERDGDKLLTYKEFNEILKQFGFDKVIGSFEYQEE